MEFFSSLFSRRPSTEPTKPVVDPDTIVDPIDFFGPDFPVEQGFKEIDAYVRTLPEKGYIPVSDILRLQFYSLYKQATVGDIDETAVKQPSMLRDWEGYWKVVGWRKCKGMSKERARDGYIELFDSQVRRHSKLKWGATVAADRWAAFYDGVQRVQNLPKNGYHLADELRARVYAMYKQATVGNLKDFQKSELAATEKKYRWLRSRPAKSGFDQLRYDEWKKLGGMSQDHAKRLYCQQVFRAGASYGYVWDPPGTEGHLEVLGDQTTAKNFKKMDEDMLPLRRRTERDPDDPEAPEELIEGSGVKLTALERVALKKFLEREKKELAKKAANPNQKTAPPMVVAAEALEICPPEREGTASSVMLELHVDPLEGVATEGEAALGSSAAEASAAGTETAGEEENGESPTKKASRSGVAAAATAEVAPPAEEQSKATAEQAVASPKAAGASAKATEPTTASPKSETAKKTKPKAKSAAGKATAVKRK